MATFQAILSRLHFGQAEPPEERTCLTCHFLVTSIQKPMSEDYDVHTARQRLRESLAAGDNHALGGRDAACRHDKYEPISVTEPERMREEMRKNRSRCDRFWRYRPLLSGQEAEHLQDFELHQATALRAARLSSRGLWVTGIGTLLIVLERLFELAVTRGWIRLP